MFWKSHPTKFIRLTDNEELKIVLSSVLIYLLSHKHCEATIEGQNGRVIKNFFSIFNKLNEVNVQSSVCKSFVSGTVYWFFWNLLKVFQGNKFKKLRNSDFITKTPILLKLWQVIGEILMKILLPIFLSNIKHLSLPKIGANRDDCFYFFFKWIC